MREVLYRGKRTDNGEWVEGVFCPPCNICFDEIGRDDVLDQDGVPVWHDYEVDPETVGQFFGLTDRNGRKIFEGDIIRHQLTVDYSEVGRVFFDEDQCTFMRTPRHTLLDRHCQKNYEVIGNIHDDLKLSEG